MKALVAKTTHTIGNFYKYLVLSVTRILLPLSLIVGFILILEGVPMGFDGKMEVTTLEGVEQQISQGPTAGNRPNQAIRNKRWWLFRRQLITPA